MKTKAIVHHADDGEWLNVLGMKIKFLCTSEHTQGRYSSMLNTVPKGTGAPLHMHPWDESFYVLKGEISLHIDGHQHHLRMGDYAMVPANTPHAFSGLSDEEGLMLAFESPSNSHQFFQDIHNSVHTIPEDLYKMPSIGQKHQVTFV